MMAAIFPVLKMSSPNVMRHEQAADLIPKVHADRTEYGAQNQPTKRMDFAAGQISVHSANAGADEQPQNGQKELLQFSQLVEASEDGAVGSMSAQASRAARAPTKTRSVRPFTVHRR